MRPTATIFFSVLRNGRFYGFAMRQIRRSLGRLLDEFQRREATAPKLSHYPGELRNVLIRTDVHVSNYSRIHLQAEVGINTDVQLITPVNSDVDDPSGIWLGKGSYLGRRVELGVYPGTVMTIGNYTSINDNSVLLGDIRIESHCLFAYHVFLSSGNHATRLFPEWLIKDQDTWAATNFALQAEQSRPIHIEEDVWLGTGVLVGRGVYIGRGAVIGAHAVVTHDVPPYSIQAGAPSREIDTRLVFRPPSYLDALLEEHRPYFYACFAIRQQDLHGSLRDGVIYAGPTARLMLQGGPFEALSLEGRLSAHVRGLELRVRCNGYDLGTVRIEDSAFARTLPIDATTQLLLQSGQRVGVVQEHNQLELTVTFIRYGPGGQVADRADIRCWHYGLSRVVLHASHGKAPIDEEGMVGMPSEGSYCR